MHCIKFPCCSKNVRALGAGRLRYAVCQYQGSKRISQCYQSRCSLERDWESPSTLVAKWLIIVRSVRAGRKVQATGAHLFPVWSSPHREEPAKQQLRVTVARSCWNSRRFNADACRFVLRYLRLHARTWLAQAHSTLSPSHPFPPLEVVFSTFRTFLPTRRTSALDKYSPTTRTSSSIPNPSIRTDLPSSRGRDERISWQMAVTNRDRGCLFVENSEGTIHLKITSKLKGDYTSCCANCFAFVVHLERVALAWIIVCGVFLAYGSITWLLTFVPLL